MKTSTSLDGKADPEVDDIMAGMKTLTPMTLIQGQEYEEQYGLDSQGFRTVRYFTGPPLPPVNPRFNWEKGDEVVPPTPGISQAIPPFASIEAAQRKLAQAGAAPIIPATPLPVPPAPPLPLSLRQETDEEGDIDAGGVDPAFPETWDEAMEDADPLRKEEGLGDSKHAPKEPKDTKEKVEEKEKEDIGADRKEKGKDEEYRAMDPKEGWHYALELDSVMAIAGESKGKSRGDKAVLDAMWGMELKMDREVNGTQAWDAALQEATSMGCPDHLLAVKKKWEGWRTRLIDRRESAMIRVAGEVEALKNQMAVVMSALDVAMPGQEKLAEKQKNKVAAAQRELDLAK